MTEVGPIEKPKLSLLKDPKVFVGPEAWALIGAREIWNSIYLALAAGKDVREVLFESWPELVAFDSFTNHIVEDDRAQGGNAWARRVAWWDNTVAQRQQIVDEFSDTYKRLQEKLEERLENASL